MKHFRLEFDDKFHKEIKVTASQKGKSMTEFIKEAIKEKLEKEKGE